MDKLKNFVKIILEMDKKKSFLSAMLGVILASIIMMVLYIILSMKMAQGQFSKKMVAT